MHLLKKVYTETDILFVWVRSHQNISSGNEIADKLAKEASVTLIDPSQIYYNTICSDLTNIFDKKILMQWESFWKDKNLTTGRKYAEVQSSLPKRVWFHKNFSSRKNITTICRMRLGHACYPQHLHRIGVYRSPVCSCDNISVGTLDHIILSCVLYTPQRRIFFSQLHSANIYPPYTLRALLCNTASYKYINNFLNDINFLM